MDIKYRDGSIKTLDNLYMKVYHNIVERKPTDIHFTIESIQALIDKIKELDFKLKGAEVTIEAQDVQIKRQGESILLQGELITGYKNKVKEQSELLAKYPKLVSEIQENMSKLMAIKDTKIKELEETINQMKVQAEDEVSEPDTEWD